MSKYNSFLENNILTIIHRFIDNNNKINILEIGSENGLETLFLSDLLLNHSESKLYCINKYNNIYLENIKKSKNYSKIKLLTKINNLNFDFIYINNNNLIEYFKYLNLGGLLYINNPINNIFNKTLNLLYNDNNNYLFKKIDIFKLIIPIINNDIYYLGLYTESDKIIKNYDSYFYKKYINKNIKNMLEIGFHNESNLKLWLTYLPNCFIYGLNLNTSFEKPYLKIIKGSQSNENDLNNLINIIEYNKLDLIIDDGTYIPEDQIGTFIKLFPTILKNKGIYIIKNIQNNYIINLIHIFNNFYNFYNYKIFKITYNQNCIIIIKK